MRFITEFETPTYKFVAKEYIAACRTRYALDIGNNISDAFGWQQAAKTTLDGNNSIRQHHKLEIEAFPMDKWLDFKDKLNGLLSIHCTSWATSEIYAMIESLESFGKPSGDTVTNISK